MFKKIISSVALLSLLFLMPERAQTQSDSVLIQTQIDQQSFTGGEVNLSPRTYYLSQPVHVPTNVILRGAGAATHLMVQGNFYAVSLEGSFSGVSNLKISSASLQTGGGGITFESADYNNFAQEISFEHNLSTGINVAPNADGKGIYTLRDLRWNGVASSGTAIRIGDGIHHISDISISKISGTASTPQDMQVWIDVKKDTDTIVLDNVTLIKGLAGIRVGYGVSTPSAVTGFSLTNGRAIESMVDYGVLIQSANNVRLNNLSLAQNRGGVGIGAGVRGLILTDSVIHNNLNDAITMWAGASGANISNNFIADNNISASQWGFGISIGAGVSNFTVSNNRIGNGLMWGNGFQRYCIFLAPGASNNYTISQNACLNHTVSNVIYDGGTGTSKLIVAGR